MDLAPLSYLANMYGDQLRVAYIDAHADLNAPEDSGSGHFHGMYLRGLLDRTQSVSADTDLIPPFAGFLQPHQITFCGTRDLDETEKTFLDQHGLRTLSPKTVQTNPEKLADALTGKTGEDLKLHIHLDLDALDPNPASFPHVSVPAFGGLQKLGLLQLLRLLVGAEEAPFHGKLVGLTVTEFNPTPTQLHGTDASTAGRRARLQESLDFLGEALGKSGINIAAQIMR